MKGFIIGLIIGGAAAWGWYQTDKGKISITKTKTITNAVSVTVTTTNITYVDQTRFIDVYRTNEVWKTNIVEKVTQTIPVATVVPVEKNETQLKPVEPIIQQDTNTPEIKKPIGLGGPKPVPGGTKVVKYNRRTGEKTIIQPIKKTAREDQ